MISQRLIWTALPNGRGGGFLTLSVMLSPRLFTDQSGATPPLSSFPDFVDWPSTLASIHFSVQLGGGSPHPATIVTPGALAPSSSRWTALFAPTAFVRPFAYQSYAGRKVRSYPAARVRNFLRDGIYAPVMHAYATNFPPRSALVAPVGAGSGLLQPIAFGANGNNGDTEDTVAAEIDTQLVAPNFAIPPGTLADPTHDFVQLHQFLAPRTVPPAGSTDGTLPGPTVPVIDFHQVVSAIGDHAALLRIFGFVVDLRVPDPGGSISTVKVIPTWTPVLTHSTDVMPLTKTDKSFLAKPSAASVPISGGLLRLDDPSFDVLEVDTDGAAVKALSLARTLLRLNTIETSIETPTDSSVPSLRADGLGVVQSGRAYDLANLTDGTLATGDGFNALAESKPVGKITLGAESLLRGFRVDVWDDTVGRWFQLCARTAGSTGGYRVGLPPGPVIPVPAGDEGFIAMSPTTSSDSTAPNDLYLQESLFTWTGWSLSGVRPGSVLSKDPDNATVPPAGNPAATPFPLEITYAAAPNTLPILRFGRTYQFRLRTVDLAGNSLPFDAATKPAKVNAVTAPLTFRRFEPVVAPMTLMRKLQTEGESVERLVIRSNYDVPDTDPSILPCERHVAPPVIAQLLAEQHGLWDLANGGPDPAAYAAIKSRDGQTFTSATTDPNNYDQPYFDVNHITVPYNPDPLAIGAAFSELPGATAVNPITKVEFFPTGTSFPKSRAFRLAAHAGTTAPTFRTPSGGPVLDVYLPKATIATVRLSSYLDADDLDLLGVWGWTSAADQSSLQSDATDGQVWPLTPYREIILVHAVRQPLLAPDFGSTPPLASSRAIGDTTAQIAGTADFDRASTDRIDVRAAWNEFVDAGANPNPDVPTSAAAHVGSIPIANDGTAGNTPVALVHTFGDTRHREIFYEALATSRFTEYFVERKTITLTGTTPVTLDSGGLVDGSVVVTQPAAGGGSTTFELDVDYVVDLGAGTIARTPSSAIVSGSSVQVAYLAPPVTRSSFEGTPGGTHVTVQSSARPAAPIVRYAIPAFAFSAATQADGTFKSVRGGNLLRIYLGRPWWSSGEGELLGVALANFVAPVAEFSTRWGRDPVFSAAGVPHVFPQISDFPLATASGVSLSIAEQSGPGVNVVGHTVEYDATRDLWYSDIEIDPGPAYRPFVRLVLARYQPDSLSGVELSPLVTIDCSQATPDRTTIVTTSAIDPNHPSVIPVSVSGYAPTGGPFGLGSVMIARVERQTFDDDLGWDQAAPEVTLSPSIVSGVTVWSGTVNRHAGPVGTYRVVVEEREQYFVDSPGGAQATRTVFLDAVLL